MKLFYYGIGVLLFLYVIVGIYEVHFAPSKVKSSVVSNTEDTSIKEICIQGRAFYYIDRMYTANVTQIFEDNGKGGIKPVECGSPVAESWVTQ